MTGIIDYGIGNLSSVARAFERLSLPAKIISTPKEMSAVDRLILPGVGHFAAGMEKLKALDLIPCLKEMALVRKVPILGLCLGMQLMTQHSEEGDMAGLGWFDAKTVRFSFPPDSTAKIPHMGWNDVAIRNDCPIAPKSAASSYYFAHSYYVKVNDATNVGGETEYGGVRFASIIRKENIYGVQFHPEKSHAAGLELLSMFASL